jgi:dGTPase
MNWEQLLSLKRFGDTKKRLRIEQDETRLGFEVDYDRIVFSDSFRSLQDKTQVVPLSKTDFVHTRLTHSLEVSVVARSLGRIIGKHLLQKYPELVQKGYQVNDFGAIVATAAIAHDIGNPPFGHSGEKAIGEYFKTGNGQQYKTELSDKQWQDLIDFEGNANGLKIVTEGSLRLSYATLGTFMKYPKESLPKKPSTHIVDKKFGFFQSEKTIFKDIVSELGLTALRTDEHLAFNRHPLAFLVEAADDICYTIIDFEDGINLGLVEEEFALEYLIKLVKNTINTKKYHALNTKKDRVSYLRALAINTLINEAAAIFINNETAILKGEFKQALLNKSQYEAQINDIIKISIERIYKSKDVIEKEVAGYHVITNLLDVFITAIHHKFNGNASNYHKIVLRLLPEKHQIISDTLYDRIMQICSFVSGLSDSTAIALHQKLNGNAF